MSRASARPFHVEWARSTIAQCRAAGCAVFVKQLGARPFREANEDETNWSETARGRDGDALDHPAEVRLDSRKGGDPAEWPEDLRVREFPNARAA